MTTSRGVPTEASQACSTARARDRSGLAAGELLGPHTTSAAYPRGCRYTGVQAVSLEPSAHEAHREGSPEGGGEDGGVKSGHLLKGTFHQ